MDTTTTGGSVRVANEVIASIAGMAAEEIDGVVEMDDASAHHFDDWIRRQNSHRGVRVAIDADRAIHLDVFLTVSAGAVVPEVAEQVQANVIEAIERMLGLTVAEVNVLVSRVAFVD
jgi:uncharacterized alkaline shock family protein YloU